MRKFAFVCLLGLAALGMAGTAAADPIVVDRSFVAEAMKRGAIIWDVRDTQAYRQGHIPGAVNIGDAGVVLRNPNTEDFIPTPEVEKILGAAGIDPAKEIVVYSNTGSPWTNFGVHTIQYFGGKKVHAYHGGIEDWRAAGNPVTGEPTKLPPVALKLKESPSLIVSTKEVVGALNKPNVQILDVRTPREYSGDDIRAIRGGHVPGAINIPYEQNWKDPETPKKLATKQAKNKKEGMLLKGLDELKALYAKLDPNKETIVYCQSGVRASQTAQVLKDLGFKNVKVYESSWLGYGNTLDAPAENVTFFNVGALNGRLAAMQRRIEELERELAAAKKAK